MQKAYLDWVGVDAARAALLDSINQGVALTSFVGHSDWSRWTFDGLLLNGDVAALSNAGKPTVVTQWGCWNTYYVQPQYNTMGHKFMLSGDRGAAAVLGASTLTQSSNESALGELLMPRIVAPGMTIGEAVVAAKQELAATDPEPADVLLGWTLLGDPAVVVEP